MDDTAHFAELSALLTGLYDRLLNDPEDRALNAPIAEEYARRLRGTFPVKFPALLKAKPLDNQQTGRVNWNTAAHIMGTTIMGDDPRDSVVDRWGRTHDISNLWIVGSSVFSRSATANPTLTIGALTLRTAAAIHRQMQGGA